MADEKWLKIPYFAKGSAEALESALTTGRFADGLDKALFYFATDTNQWILVDIDKTVHVINSYNSDDPGGKGAVKRVDALPSILDADPKTLYIVGKVVYSFDGNTFYPTYQELLDKIIGVLPENTTLIEYIEDRVNSGIAVAASYTDDVAEEMKAEAIAAAKEYTDNSKNETVIVVNQYTDEVAAAKKDEAVAESNQYADELLALHIVQGGGE